MILLKHSFDVSCWYPWARPE